MSVDITSYLDLSFWLKRDDVSCRDAEGSEIPPDLAKIETVSLWCCKVCKTSGKAHRCANTERHLMLVWSKEAGFNMPVITTIVENAAPTKRDTVEDDSDFFAALESGPVEPTNPPVPDLAEIQRAYDLLVAPLNRVVELRSPASTKGTWGGVYDTAELVQDTFVLSGKAGVTSVYWTIQSIDSAKQKPINGIKPYCKKGELTNDEQVSRYLHLAIDVDPNREGVISSTGEEKACVLDDYSIRAGFPDRSRHFIHSCRLGERVSRSCPHRFGSQPREHRTNGKSPEGVREMLQQRTCPC